MTESQYCVAGFFFSLSLPDGQDADRLLPSFRPFLCEKKPQEESIFQLTVLSEAGPEIETASTLLDRTLNDIGYTSLYAFSGGYQVSISPWPEGPQHILQTDKEFTQATATILWTDPYAGHILSALSFHRPFSTGKLFPSMLLLYIQTGRATSSWEKAVLGKVHMQPCGLPSYPIANC